MGLGVLKAAMAAALVCSVHGREGLKPYAPGLEGADAVYAEGRHPVRLVEYRVRTDGSMNCPVGAGFVHDARNQQNVDHPRLTDDALNVGVGSFGKIEWVVQSFPWEHCKPPLSRVISLADVEVCVGDVNSGGVPVGHWKKFDIRLDEGGRHTPDVGDFKVHLGRHRVSPDRETLLWSGGNSDPRALLTNGVAERLARKEGLIRGDASVDGDNREAGDGNQQGRLIVPIAGLVGGVALIAFGLKGLLWAPLPRSTAKVIKHGVATLIGFLLVAASTFATLATIWS